MTEEKFMIALYACAKRCGYDLDEFEIEIYVQELEPYGWDKVVQAMRDLYLSLKSKAGMPTVTEIKVRLGAVDMTDPDQANSVAGLVCGGVTRWGSTLNQARMEQIKAGIGELGWVAIQQLFGGWNQFCEQLTFDNRTTMQAQIRDYVKGLIERAKRGQINHGPALPAGPMAGTIQAQLPGIIDVAKLEGK